MCSKIDYPIHPLCILTLSKYPNWPNKLFGKIQHFLPFHQLRKKISTLWPRTVFDTLSES